MSLANSSILDWRPEGVEESVSTPCGGEHIRSLVLPQTPRRPVGAPRMPSETQETPTTPRMSSSIYACSNTPTASDKVITIQKILKAQQAEMVKFIQDSMLRHEAAITSLLNLDSLDLCMNENEKAVDEAVAPVETDGFAATTMDVDAIRASSYSGTEPISPLPSQIRSRNFSKSLIELKEPEDLNLRNCMCHHRDFFRRILSSRVYDTMMALLIVFNSILIIVEADTNAGCYQEVSGCVPSWLFIANLVLLVIYTFESFAVIDVYRQKIFADRSRMLELFVVVAGYADMLISILGESLPSMQIFKLVRLTRLLRGMRLFSMCPELYMIVIGFISSMRVMVWGFVLLMAVLIILSIITVELLQDLNKRVGHDSQYCNEAFDSVWSATILLFQITAAGDSWGACSIEMMKLQPFTFIFFGSSVVAVQIGFLNLIMSVIIERVEDARASDTANRFRGKQREMKANKRKWAKLFDTLDADGNGQLSLVEIVEGFERVASFREDWALLGIMTEDLPELFYLIDENKDGFVTLDELLELLHKLYHSDRDMQQIIMSMQLRLVTEHLVDRLKNIESNISFSALQLPKTAS